MKRTLYTIVTAVAMLCSGCGTMMTGNGTQGSGGIGDILGGILGNQNTVDGLLDMVIGHIKISQDQLIGNWSYTAPGCAFTSENLLAKAGGAVAAAQVKEKLQSAYDAVGINADNSQFVFTQDGQFSAKVRGIPFTGTYTYDPSTGTIQLNTLLISTKAFITRTTKGLALTFESKKLLTVLQAAAALSGNNTIKTVGDLSKEFEGVRVGFDMVRIR